MSNMTADSMDHMATDLHHPTDHTSMSMMMNYFHFSAESTILFAGWKTTTWGGKLYAVQIRQPQ